MIISITPIQRDGRNGFRVRSGLRETEVFGNSKATTIDGARALAAAEMVRGHTQREGTPKNHGEAG